MPSPHSSPETQADARAIARNLGAELIELPIEAAMQAYGEILGDNWSSAGLAAENVQARIRGNLLMALSNDRGALVLTTGNKSEMSVGLRDPLRRHGGRPGVIKDVPKHARLRAGARTATTRAAGELVPTSVIERPPSAELRADQLDEDSLPPYELLDRVLEGYVERDLSREALVAEGLPPEVVDEVIRLVDLAEYKRRQSPPGIRDDLEGVRARPAAADHQPLRRLARAPSLACLRIRERPLGHLIADYAGRSVSCAPLRRGRLGVRHDLGALESQWRA